MFYSNFTPREQAPYGITDDGTILYTQSEAEAWLAQHPEGYVNISMCCREDEIASEMIASVSNALMDLFDEINVAIEEEKLTLKEATAAMEDIAVDELFESFLEDKTEYE